MTWIISIARSYNIGARLHDLVVKYPSLRGEAPIPSPAGLPPPLPPRNRRRKRNEQFAVAVKTECGNFSGLSENYKTTSAFFEYE